MAIKLLSKWVFSINLNTYSYLYIVFFAILWYFHQACPKLHAMHTNMDFAD